MPQRWVIASRTAGTISRVPLTTANEGRRPCRGHPAHGMGRGQAMSRRTVVCEAISPSSTAIPATRSAAK